MGSHYVYKIFRKIKIVKYCKIWPNMFDICDLAIFDHILQHFTILILRNIL